MCQNTTSAVIFIHKNLGYSCKNGFDDFRGAETPDKSAATCHALCNFLYCLGLSTLLEKDVAAASDCLHGFSGHTCQHDYDHDHSRNSILGSVSLLSFADVSCHELQSLLGVMSFITTCFCPTHVFISSFLHTPVVVQFLSTL